MNEYKAGSTGIIETIFLQDSSSTVGGGKTGLAYNTTGLTCYYKRSSGTASVSVTLVDITTLGTFASGGFRAIDGTNMPGVYEFHPPNAAFAAGAKEVTFFFQGAAGLVQRPIKFRLQGIDVDTAFPTAATIWDEVLTGATHNITNSAGKILRTITTNTDALYPTSGTVNLTAATATTATLDAGASATAQIYRGNILSITGGTGSGQSRIITDYSTGRVATVDRAWVTNPDTSSTFEITPTASTQVASYATGMDPATLTLGATASAWNTFGTVGAKINTAGAGSDPWGTSIPGAYGIGTAGYILGTNLNATMTSRQPSGNVTVGAYASGQSPETLVWDASLVGHNTASTFGNTVQGLTSGGGADPWTTSLPGSYGAGSAGYIVGTYINATISSRNSGNVTVGGYATNQDPAAYVLATPANKLATDSSGYVRVQSGSGTGQILNSSGRVTVGAYATGQDPASSVWGATVPASYVTGQAGYYAGASGVAAGKMTFDGFNNLLVSVNNYTTGNDPGATVWGAATSYNTVGTMGKLQNSPIVAGYASGQAPDYLVWNAALVTYNTLSTFGNKVQGLANAADPWTASVGTGYSSGQAGYFLNAIKQQSDKLTFDGSNSVQSRVYSYASGMDPETQVWEADGTDHVASGTFGGIVNGLSGGSGGGSTPDPWATNLPGGSYATGQAGYLVNAMSNIIDRFNFDTSSNVLSSVNAYAAGQDPAAKVWDALRADHATADTFGQMAGAPIVAGYASGQSPAASVLGALLSSYTSPGTAGAKLNAIGGDPWAAAVGAGYLSTQAGAILNQIGSRVDGPISGVPQLLMDFSIYPSVSFLQGMRAAATAAGGDVVRVGSSLQFRTYRIGDTTHTYSPAITSTTDGSFLTRQVNALNL